MRETKTRCRREGANNTGTLPDGRVSAPRSFFKSRAGAKIGKVKPGHYLITRFVFWTCAIILPLQISAQTPTPTPPQPPRDDVILINTELVQTDVMVFDKKGSFISGLKPLLVRRRKE